MTATVNDTARALLAHLRDAAEWGAGNTRIEQSVPSPELVALCGDILAHAPAAWRPYGPDRDDGYLILAAPNPPEQETLTRFGLYHRTMMVHDLARPAGWAATPSLDERSAQQQAVVALLVGLASMATDEDDDDPSRWCQTADCYERRDHAGPHRAANGMTADEDDEQIMRVLEPIKPGRSRAFL